MVYAGRVPVEDSPCRETCEPAAGAYNQIGTASGLGGVHAWSWCRVPVKIVAMGLPMSKAKGTVLFVLI